MIRIPVITVFFFAFMISAGNMQAQDVVDKVQQLVEKGDAEELVTVFNNPVDLKIREEEGIYSPDHSRMALRKFFKKHPPASFTINHRGESNEGPFAVGSYACTEGHSFRIYFLMRQGKAKPKVLQFFIEED